MEADRDFRTEYKLNLSPSNKNKTKLIIDEVLTLIIIKERKRHWWDNIIRVCRGRSGRWSESYEELHSETGGVRQKEWDEGLRTE